MRNGVRAVSILLVAAMVSVLLTGCSLFGGKTKTAITEAASAYIDAVKTFDNGTATVNTETCETLGFNFDDIKETFGPYCTQVNSITTAENFE